MEDTMSKLLSTGDDGKSRWPI